MRRVHRSDRGESTVSVLLGVAIGLLVIGGFAAFWVSADRASVSATAVTEDRAAINRAVQRIGRDLGDADRLVMLGDQAVVVASGQGQASKLVRWAVVDGSLVRHVSVLTTGVPYNESMWDGVGSRPVARHIDPEARLFSASDLSSETPLVEVKVATLRDGSRTAIWTAASIGQP